MTSLGDALERVARPPEETRADNLRSWRTTIPDTTPIAELASRERVKVAGVIQNIRIDPREGTGSVEATITDGTGQIVGKWLGRRKLAGMRLGRGLIMQGVCGHRAGQELTILNPEYELVAGPEHG